MSAQRNTGNDPAHPIHPETERMIHQLGTGYGSIGLTKRELFAAMAMQGIRASGHPHAPTDSKTIAQIAVEDADALLEELAKDGDA